MSAANRHDLVGAIREVTDTWEEPLDEVNDVPQIVNAVLAYLATLTPDESTARETTLLAMFEEIGQYGEALLSVNDRSVRSIGKALVKATILAREAVR